MFSTSLRRRPSLTTLLPLLSSSTAPKLLETLVATHDLAFPLQPPPTITHNQQPPTTHLPLLILTPTSLHPTNHTATLERITRLSTLSTSPQPLVVFLLTAPPVHSGAVAGLHAYLSLQTLTFALPLPPNIIPIPAPTHLLGHLTIYTSTLTAPSPKIPSPVRARDLLQYTTTERKLSEHAANIISDVCGNLRGVVEMIGVEGKVGGWVGMEGAIGRGGDTESGVATLVQWVGEEGWEIAGFFREEWVWE